MCEILHKFGELGGSFARGRPSLAICIYIYMIDDLIDEVYVHTTISLI